MARKYSFQTIKDGVVPEQVSETINLDEEKISLYEKRLIGMYDSLEKSAKKLTREYDSASKSKKGLKGKVKVTLGKLEQFCAKQNKASKDVENRLKDAIRADTKSLSNAINASHMLAELDQLLDNPNVQNDASLTAYFQGQRNNLVSSVANSTGFTLGNNGTLSSNGTTYVVNSTGSITRQ